MGAWHRRPELVERVHGILKRGPGLSPAAARGLLAVVGCGLVLGSVEFARCPQLVAFAGPSAPTAQDVAESLAPGGFKMGDYRTVQAMARVPSRAELAAMRAVPQAARVQGSASLATEKSRKGGVRKDLAIRRGAVTVRPDEMLTAMAAQAGQATIQQLVVFTAFEQVETADAAQPTSESQAQNEPAVARQFMVTQLILRVYPAADKSSAEKAGAGSASSSGTSSRSNSRASSNLGPAPVQQVVPLRDGWLVFQL